VSNIFVLNNTIGTGRLLFIASHGAGPVDNIVVKGNRLIGHGLGIDVLPPENSRRSNWVVENNVSDVTARHRPLRFFRIDGLVVRGNRQDVTNGDPGVVLNDVCGAHVADNDFGKGGVRQTNPPCPAPLVVPIVPALAGRSPTGTGVAPSTIALPTVPAPTVVPPTSAPPTTSVPSGASDAGGGFDLADGIFVALGALVALAIVLGLRARRPRPPS